MIKIIEKQKEPEKRYSVATVAKATGKSESSVFTYFSNRGISVKNGITLDQTAEVCRAKTRGQIINCDDVRELRERLEEKHGIIIAEE